MILSLEKSIDIIIARMKIGYSRDTTPEDVKGVAWLGAIEAVDKFDSSRGLKLITLANRIIYFRIMDHLRKVTMVPRHTYLKMAAAGMVVHYERVSLNAEELPTRIDPEFERVECRHDCRAALAILTVSQQRYVRDYLAEKDGAASVLHSHIIPTIREAWGLHPV
jgi:hypothetical protein